MGTNPERDINRTKVSAAATIYVTMLLSQSMWLNH